MYKINTEHGEISKYPVILSVCIKCMMDIVRFVNK